MSLPEAFLATDANLRIVHKVVDGLPVFPAMVSRNLSEELPLMASEAILMEAVQRGGDRQAVHERLRIHARAAASTVLTEGGANPFLALVAEDREVPLERSELEELLDPARFVGRAPEQVREFLAEHVQPILDRAGEFPQARDLDV
jgi:adenylosuccinate lyase